MVAVPFRASRQEMDEESNPDGRLSHWLKVGKELREAAGANVGDLVTVRIAPADQEPEPPVPDDLHEALSSSPAAREVWEGTTAIARLGWIHWIESANQAKTRKRRVERACDAWFRRETRLLLRSVGVL